MARYLANRVTFFYRHLVVPTQKGTRIFGLHSKFQKVEVLEPQEMLKAKLLRT